MERREVTGTETGRREGESERHKVDPYLDLLYSNSMCKQSSIPTSIFKLSKPSSGKRRQRMKSEQVRKRGREREEGKGRR